MTPTAQKDTASDNWKPTGTARYGELYWCVKVPNTVSPSGEIYVMADRVVVDATGALMCLRDREDGLTQPNLILAPRKWTALYAASCIDGSAVAVEHWQGEVVRR